MLGRAVPLAQDLSCSSTAQASTCVDLALYFGESDSNPVTEQAYHVIETLTRETQTLKLRDGVVGRRTGDRRKFVGDVVWNWAWSESGAGEQP